jgi:TM2 domain-containing membrane protein YozV
MYDANEYIGKSYKMGAKFSDAILYFTYAEMNANNGDEIFQSKIEIIRSNILRRTPLHAISLLDSLMNDRRFLDKSKEIHYWLGWSYIFNDQWNEAAKEFNLTNTNKTLVELCNKTYDKKYSASFAKIISLFIPGAGQVYTGHYFSGALSLGWNVLWGYTTINAFAANRIFDGLVIGNLLWFRFYNGNLQNAYNFAVEENLIITNSAMNYLQFEFKGLKP